MTVPTGYARDARRSPLLITIAILAVLMIVMVVAARLWTDYLWFDNVEFSTVFTTQLVAQVGLYLVFGLLMAAGVYFSMALAYRLRPSTRRANLDSELLIQFRDALDSRFRVLMLIPSVVLGLLGGAVAASGNSIFLAWLNATDFGTSDPFFHHDASFYVFHLPWWQFVLNYVTFIAVASTIAVFIVHFLTGSMTVAALRNTGNEAASTIRGQRHVSIMVGIVLVLMSISQFLTRYSYLTTQNSMFTGMSYTDHNARVTAHLILAVAGLIVAGVFFYNAWKVRWNVPAVSLILLVVTSLILSTGYPWFLQQFTVRPNEQDKERPYLQANIDATRYAFGVDKVKIQEYEATTSVSAGQLREDAEALPAIRLMDPAVVGPTFEQLQQVRGYYKFAKTLDVDRYEIEGRPTDAVVAARELDLSSVEAGDTWNNMRTVYTHGYGMVAAYGNQRHGNGEPVYFSGGIPTVGRLPEHEPRIYYGELNKHWVVAGAPKGQNPVELDTPGGGKTGGEQLYTYTGKGGVPIGSLIRRAAFAIRMGDINLLLSDRVNSESRLLFNRMPIERVQEVAPWLTVDSDPYPSVVDGRILWILDGYTTTADYPNSTRVDWARAISDTRTTQQDLLAQGTQVNYVRNSVKVTVDAYDGTVKLYEWDEKDPILKTWAKTFPGSITPKSKISTELLAHLRYPQDLFKVQRQTMSRYHTTNPNTLYQESDIWQVPNDPVRGGKEGLKEPPYFLTIRWPGDDEPVYSNTTVFVPRERENLSVYMAVNGDARTRDYGQIRVLKLSDKHQIAGPGQTFNAIATDAQVAETLLPFNRQGSANAIYGNLLTLPVGGGLLYVQPIYTQTANTSGAYPALRFVVVRFGEHVGIGQTLQQALDKVFQGDAGAVTGEDVKPNEKPKDEPVQTLVGGEKAKKLLEDAVKASDAAEKALKQGDLAAYQAENVKATKLMEDALKALKEEK